MYRNFALLILIVGLANASFWVSVDAEYMPGDTIEIGVGGASGTLVVDVFDSEGISVFHEVRSVEQDSEHSWYTPYETFELTLPIGEYIVVAKEQLGEEESQGFRVSSIGIMAISPAEEWPVLYDEGGSGTTLGAEEGMGVFLHKIDGSAIEGGRIILTYNKSGDVTQTEVVSGVGGVFNFDSEGLQTIRGEYDEEATEIEYYNYGNYEYESAWKEGDTYSSYVFSDKTLYQPGETVHVSAVIFLESEDAYETVLGTFEVEVRGPNYDTVYSNSIAAVNSRVSFDLPLDEEAALGRYSVQIRKNQSYAGWHNFEVQEYKRPEIDVSLGAREDVYTINQTIYVDVNTEYYFGGPADAEVKFEIYRGPHYVPYYRSYYSIGPWWREEKVAEGLIYTKDGVGTIEWNGTNVTGDYRIDVSVTDESEIISEAETTVSVLEEVNLEVLMPEMQVNESGLITLLAFDEHDVPLEISGTIKIYKSEEYRHYESGKGYVINESAVPEFEGEFISLEGSYSFEYAPEEYGSYYLVAEAGDAKLEQYFYVSEYSWSSWNYLEVSLDKTEYISGEKIEATVTSPIEGRLIVASMGSGPEVEFFEVSPGINTLELTAEETSSVQFFVIRDGERYSGYANYMVRGNNWVEVEIDHEAVYKPGGIARIIITATRAGAQSNAAASVSIVDQAIIDLSGAAWNDIYSQFYGYPLENYEVQFSWNGYSSYGMGRGMLVDGMVEEMALPAAAPGEGGDVSKEEITVREKFVETALWIPYIILENGKKEIIWHIPDTLTTWNITVVANENVAVGMGTSDVLVTKDVIGRMSIPSALVVDDALAVPITVFNYGEERKTFKVTLESSSNIWILGSPIEHISLDAGSSETIYVPVKAMEAGVGELTLFVEGGEGDAVKLPLDVMALGVKIVDAESGVVEGTPQTISYDAPLNATVSLALHSSILGSAFESLDYLVNYPYGCIEQTMSGFLPDVVLVHTLDELGLEYGGEENVTALIDDGLARIYEHQNSDGSWGWFNGQDERITAYVMDGLTIAKRTGIEVDSEVYSRGLSALKSGNSSYGRFVLNQIDSSLVTTYANDSFGALTECDDGDCARLVSMLECSGQYCHLEFDGENKWYHSDIELTAYAIESLVKNDDMEDARKCVNWLMAHKTGTYWRSTKDTAVTVLALTEYAKKTGELSSDYVAYVYLDGEKIFEERLGYKSAESKEISLPDGAHQVVIERQGYGPLYYTLTETYYTDEIPEGEIEVEREYSQTYAKVGDEITVTLHINGSGEYVAIEDPIPMGTEIIQEGERYWWYYGGYRMEAREDKAVFFFDRMGEETELTYKLRVMYKGDFTALPTHAYAMYAPEISGYSDFEHFTFYEKAYVEPYVTEYNTTLKVYWDGDEPGILRVSVDGAETEYTVEPGENEITVDPGKVTYSFESDEEYFEGEVGEAEEEGELDVFPGPLLGDNVYKGLLLIVVGVVVLLIVYRQFRKK